MMSRLELIDKLKLNFNIKELVCKHCHDRFKDLSWLFLSTEILSTLYTLRFEIFKCPMIINNWSTNGTFSLRGLRCNMCQLIKSKKSIYLTPHGLGKAIDFNIKNLTIEETKNLIRLNKDKFEYPIRLEANTTTWCHVDVYQPDSRTFVEFNG